MTERERVIERVIERQAMRIAYGMNTGYDRRSWKTIADIVRIDGIEAPSARALAAFWRAVVS